MSKKNTIFTLSALTAIAGSLYAFTRYFYKISSIPRQHTDDMADLYPSITPGRTFVRNHEDKEDIFIHSVDNIELHAGFIKAPLESHKYVILIHGIWDNHEANGIFAKHYLEKGINCLLPDLRGFGKSDGSYIGYGFHDRLDITEWIRYLLKRDPDARIILHGMSMGAATTLMTTGEFLPDNVKCAIADSSYTTLREQFATTYKTYKGSIVPVPLALFLIRLIILNRSGFDINDVNCLAAVKRSTTPTLFIHGDEDTFIDPHMCSRLYEAAGCERQYLMITGARHIEGVIVDPDAYWNKIDAFISKYI